MKQSMKRKMILSLCAAMVMTSAVAISNTVEASAETCLLEMRTGASVRISETESGTGIRFLADIDDSLVTETVEGVGEYSIQYQEGVVEELGMIIVPAFALENVGNSDVFQYLKTTYGKDKSEVSATPNKVYKDKDGYYVAGAIIDILPENLSYEYQAIPYTYDGENYTYGVASVKRSIHYVFEKALEEETDSEKRAKVLNKVVEMQDQLKLNELFISNFDGYDLSKFTVSDNADWKITSAGVGEYVATPENGKLNSLALPWQATAEETQDFTISYGNGKSLTLDAKVWMKKISTVNDLLMFDHASGKMTNTTNTANYGTASLDVQGGYFGLTNDITCNLSQTVYVRWMSASQNLIFDGNGFTIYNFWGNLMHDAKGTFKDINFVNAKARDCRGLFACQLVGGTKIENVNIEVALENYTASSAICANAINGTVTLNNVNVVVKNGYASNVNYANGCRQGILAGRVLDSGSGKFLLNDCTFVSDNVDGSLPLLGISPESTYIEPSEIANAAYANCVSGTYKHYGYNELGQAAYEATKQENADTSFGKFVVANNLANKWGVLNVALTAVSDTAGLKAMVGATTGYYYLTKDITFDATVWGEEVTRKTADAKTVLEGNGFAINGLTAHLFEGYNGRVQNIAFTNINGALASIAYTVGDTTVFDNVFFHGEVKGVEGKEQTAGLVAQVSAANFTAKNVVVWTTNTVVSGSYYRGAVAGLTKKTSRLNGENLVIISEMKPICPYLNGESPNWMTSAELEGTDESKPYGGYLQGDYYYYSGTDAFEENYKGTLSAQNLKYYQALINA